MHFLNHFTPDERQRLLFRFFALFSKSTILTQNISKEISFRNDFFSRIQEFDITSLQRFSFSVISFLKIQFLD